MKGEDFKNYFEKAFGVDDDNKEYRCVVCKYSLEKIMVKTMMGLPRNLFFCKNKRCKKFGGITVAALS